MSQVSPLTIQLHRLAHGPIKLRLEPDVAERAKIAQDVGLETLPSFIADVTLSPWLDGVEISGRFDAVVEQICSITLEPFTQDLEGVIEIRAVPAGSPNAPEELNREVEFDPEAPDPPDVLESDAVDVTAYVVEQLALAIDPFPRKPGAQFEFVQPTEEQSPFAVLKALKDREP